MRRYCNLCHAEINACFGSVNAGDFVDAINGRILKEDIRELCPNCSTRILLKDEEYNWSKKVLDFSPGSLYNM